MPKYTIQQHHSKKTHIHTKQQTQNIESIPPENINMFCMKFSEKNTNQIQELTNLLHNINTKSMATTL
jgi:hypothetical protein